MIMILLLLPLRDQFPRGVQDSPRLGQETLVPLPSLYWVDDEPVQVI